MPRINHNIQAMYTATALKGTERSLARTLEKLSTGLAINRASDNAAGLSVSEKLRKQIDGTGMGNRNIQDGMSVLSIAEGALIEVGNMLQRMRELAIQSSNGIYTDSQRNYIQIEIDELSNEIDRIAGCTQYNKMSLLNGDTGTSSNYNPWNSSNGAFLHIGANNVEMNDVLNVKLYAANCDALGIRDKNAIPPLPTQLVDLSNQTSAFSAISTLDDAITKVTTLRANIGAYINRLDGALTNQQNVLENVISAESLIRDTDYAEEMTNFTRLNLLQQSSVSMLAQANSLPNNILNLLKF